MHWERGLQLCRGLYFSSDQFSRKVSGLKELSAMVVCWSGCVQVFDVYVLPSDVMNGLAEF